MAIPTAIDYDLAEIDSMASNIIMGLLRTMQRANARDVDKMRVRLRLALQEYVNAVMEAAPRAAP